MTVYFQWPHQGYTNLSTEFYSYAEHLSIEKNNASSRKIVDLLNKANLLKPEHISLLVCGDPISDRVTLEALTYLHEAKLVHPDNRNAEKNLALVFGHGKDREDVCLAIRLLSEKGLLEQQNLDLFTIDRQVGSALDAMAKTDCLTQENLDKVITYPWGGGFFKITLAELMCGMLDTIGEITKQKLIGWFGAYPSNEMQISSMRRCEEYLEFGWKQGMELPSTHTLQGVAALMHQHGLLTVENRRDLLAPPTEEYVAKGIFQSLHAIIDGTSQGTKSIAPQNMKV